MNRLVHRYFPEALSLKRLLKETNSVLNKIGLTPKNTLISYSLCADEIEHRVESAFSAVWGQPFQLAGLAGFPFVGSTGMEAYFDHVPDKGYLFIIYGPHVGISQDGEVGKIERRGQHKLSSACGAAIAAYNDGDVKYEDDDLQQEYISEVVQSKSEILAKSANPMVTLPKVIFKQIKKDLYKLLPKHLPVPVILLGGININTQDVDYFQVWDFKILYPNGDFTDLSELL